MPPTPTPPTNLNTKYGFYYYGDVVGMPLAWTQTDNLNINGYYNDVGTYCYIGFEGPSPFMTEHLHGTQVYACDFPWYFYNRALGWGDGGQHHTIRQSLDYASANTFNSDFDDSAFYQGYWKPCDYGGFFTRMRVLGNGAVYIP